MKYLLSFIFTVSVLYAGVLDTWHKKIEDFFGNTIEKLDKFLSESNASVPQKYSLETSLRVFTESKKIGSGYKFNITSKIPLPRTQKRLYLFLQDFKRTTSIDEQSGNNIRDSIDNNSYLLGLFYNTKSKLKFRAGVRFHTITPDPFVGATFTHTYPFDQKNRIEFGNSLYYYLDRKLDNTFYANYIHQFNATQNFAFENSYRYIQDQENEHQILNSFKLYTVLDANRFTIPSFQFYSTTNQKRSYHVDYLYLGIKYHDTIWRKWIFYELTPAVLFREINNFQASYRVDFTVGITFSK
ncbi:MULTISPECIES: hypothetical protein [unclassified Nitratiruptor]|uniref:hypothetical protein n=1 Tax=unclassified Nitratiruptor TaxID=2624044 RepID=UPI00191549B8|nr:MULTISPECIES: hypothetical protein [unclassified Nitratiruptor]BCD60626.1 hypothetical protein NitYY0810_C1401 [Nitratiruptor sp. YY08-10]BCD64557.1 hypothetical protein NitYY0814_C1408 [Nitratiruptor sp. YY08-14]